ncbi:MAG: sensor histidine kinase [Oligoflexus sp.]
MKRPVVINQRLALNTFIGLGVVLLLGIFVAFNAFRSRLIEDARLRSETIADIVTYVAESVTELREVQRFIYALAGDERVKLILVLGPSPLKVIASSQSKYHHMRPDEMPVPDLVKNEIWQVLSEKKSKFYFMDDVNEYIIISPIRFTLRPEATIDSSEYVAPGFDAGVALVIVDASQDQAKALFGALKIVGTFASGLFLVAMWAVWLLRKRTEKMINFIELAIQGNANILSDLPMQEMSSDLRYWALALKKNLYELRRSERRLILALEGGQIGAWQWRLGDGQVIWTENLHKLLQLKANESISTFDDFLSYVHPLDRARLRHEIDQTIESGAAYYMEFRVVLEGGEKWLAGRWWTFKDDETGEVHMIGMNIDIHNRKMSEMRLQEQQAALIQTAKMSALGEMAGSVAHEINNPLAIIDGLARQIRIQLARSPLSVPKIMKNTEKISQTVLRIAAIIKGLRAISRDGTEDPFLPKRLDELFANTLSLCKERTKHNGVRLILENQISEDVEIECRESQIIQVLVNLLNNAFDALADKDHRWVKIIAQDDQNQVRISVVDSGQGIPEDLRAKMFQPFYTTKPVGTGTGLGLALSKGIIESHGGVLYYDESFATTAFTMLLPKSHLDSISHIEAKLV